MSQVGLKTARTEQPRSLSPRISQLRDGIWQALFQCSKITFNDGLPPAAGPSHTGGSPMSGSSRTFEFSEPTRSTPLYRAIKLFYLFRLVNPSFYLHQRGQSSTLRKVFIALDLESDGQHHGNHTRTSSKWRRICKVCLLL
jgi:hypothetical protein